jgi:hypothetical protein
MSRTQTQREKKRKAKKRKEKEHNDPRRKRKDCLEAAVMSPQETDIWFYILHN